jgi:membrane protease YdiL (CAAX protease family)
LTTESFKPAAYLSTETRTELPAQDRFAADLRAFGPLGILAILLVLFSPNALLGAVLVLAWTWYTGTPWHELGFVRPKNWISSVAIGIPFGVAFKVLMKALVMPLFGADPINQAYHYLAGNTASTVGMAVYLIIGAGFGEETIYRGFIFQRLGKLLGASIAARISIVLLSATWFALAHYLVQGLAGVEQAVVTGLVFGTIFAITGRIWMVMITHAAFDLAALAIIYWDLELRMAHLIFR